MEGVNKATAMGWDGDSKMGMGKGKGWRRTTKRASLYTFRQPKDPAAASASEAAHSALRLPDSGIDVAKLSLHISKNHIISEAQKTCKFTIRQIPETFLIFFLLKFIGRSSIQRVHKARASFRRSQVCLQHLLRFTLERRKLTLTKESRN